MLLCLNPEDGQGHILLSKIFASQKRWQEAIAELDTATACGARIPQGMKEQFEAARDLVSRDNRSEQIADRIGAEVRALRDETRKLRVEKTRIERTNRELERKVQVWAVGTIFTGVLALTTLGILFMSGNDSAALETVDAVDPIYAEYGVESTNYEIAAPISGEIVEPGFQIEAATAATTGTDYTENTTINSPAEIEIVSSTASSTMSGTRTYTVVAGDNLSSIARRMYGKSSVWRELATANESLLNGGIALSLGMELTIPDIE
jgi:nucleoid-associated protein YgaU